MRHFALFTSLATCLLSGGLLAAAETNGASDPFSDIPLSHMIVARAPDPKWSAPSVASSVYPFDYPRSFFKKIPQGCGSAYVSIRVLANGDFADAKLEGSSGFAVLDESALKYAAKGQRYSAGHFNGEPTDGWLTQKFQFYGSKIDCDANTDASPAPQRLPIQRKDSINVLVEQARTRNLALQAEQQVLFDAQEQKRYVSEEPYRQRIPANGGYERQAMYASELAHNFVHCGDSRFDRDVYHITEYKGAHFFYKDAEPLSEIDRANGYEWRGRVSLYCKMQRSFGFSGAGDRGWSDWTQCPTQVSRVWKRHGKWHVDGEKARPRLACADVPSG